MFAELRPRLSDFLDPSCGMFFPGVGDQGNNRLCFRAVFCDACFLYCERLFTHKWVLFLFRLLELKVPCVPSPNMPLVRNPVFYPLPPLLLSHSRRRPAYIVVFRAAPGLRHSVPAQEALPTWVELARFAAGFEPPNPQGRGEGGVGPRLLAEAESRRERGVSGLPEAQSRSYSTR